MTVPRKQMNKIHMRAEPACTARHRLIIKSIRLCAVSSALAPGKALIGLTSIMSSLMDWRYSCDAQSPAPTFAAKVYVVQLLGKYQKRDRGSQLTIATAKKKNAARTSRPKITHPCSRSNFRAKIPTVATTSPNTAQKSANLSSAGGPPRSGPY